MLTPPENLNGPPVSVYVSTSTGSKHCMELAKSWISDCEINHKLHCTRMCEGSHASLHYLPKRLLYVGDELSSTLQLVDTSSMNSIPANAKYLALMYCRGDAGLLSHQKLTLDKQSNWVKHIDKRGLPLTFRHAIQLTRLLGFNYLWIDAMCISQDDDEELERETANVGKAYANAYCTISACGSLDADGGLFRRRSPGFEEFPCYLRFSKTKALRIKALDRTYDDQSFSIEVDNSPLSQEAWAFEARLLSRRILHFGSKFLFFECNTHIASDALPQGQPFLKVSRGLLHFLRRLKSDGITQIAGDAIQSPYNPVTGYRAFMGDLIRNRSAEPSLEEQLLLHYCWFFLVAIYSRAKQESTPQQPAPLLNLAQGVVGSGNELQYMHGMWRRHFIFDLLWFVGFGEERRKRPVPCRSPTWSWQAVAGGITAELISWRKNHAGKHCNIVKVAETPNGEVWLQPTEVLTIICPVLRGTDIKRTSTKRATLQISTRHESVRASFMPDISDLDESKDLFCAEIVREAMYEKSDKKKLLTVWSNGLVLHRTLDRKAEGVKATYERVGRFWMEWPVDDSAGGTETGLRMKPMFNRHKAQSVSII